LGEIPEFKDRIDIKAHFNARKYLRWDQKNGCIRPGFRLKNSASSWIRYFFSDGFGVFAEKGYLLLNMIKM
jgi:hypothetical protein